jgi:putative membrane protein
METANARRVGEKMVALSTFMDFCREGGSHWGAGGWIWMGIMMLAGLVLIVAVVYALLKGASTSRAQGSNASPVHRETPLEIAQRRYASGEITQEEFERIKKDLSG